MPNLRPYPYRPLTEPTTCQACASVEAGDWVQFFVGFPTSLATAARAVPYKPGYFLIHMIYTPDSDDATFQKDEQSVTYGGSAQGETGNRRRQFRADPGWAFQAPFNGQLFLVAGGDAPEDFAVPIIIAKGFHPRVWLQQQAILDQLAPSIEMGSAPYEFLQVAAVFSDFDHPERVTRGPRQWAPPVVGTPQLVPCTYVDIPINGGPFPFPDGAVSVESGQPVRLTTQSLGNPLGITVPAGYRRALGPLGQGGQVTLSTPATWSNNAPLDTLTFWSSFGG